SGIRIQQLKDLRKEWIQVHATVGTCRKTKPDSFLHFLGSGKTRNGREIVCSVELDNLLVIPPHILRQQRCRSYHQMRIAQDKCEPLLHGSTPVVLADRSAGIEFPEVVV